MNQSPRPGEKAAYSVEYGRVGYCDIAYLPRPGVDGNALLLGGTDISSIAAGGHFVTDEKSMAALLKVLGASAGRTLPYFEVLLKTELLMYTAQGAQIVTSRLQVQ